MSEEAIGTSPCAMLESSGCCTTLMLGGP
jgi:hypothetical protein